MRATAQNYLRALAGILCLVTGIAVAQEEVPYAPPPLEVLISVADQKLVMLRDGGVIGKYKISTSKFGVGDSYGSYKTPLGRFRVCDKIGSELEPGAVIKHRSATGEVIQVNAPGRDPIVTRVIWLDGLEEQNHNARARGIYIHGTPEENNLGKPVSWGCIRMRSEDVIEIFNEIPSGTPVNIIPDRLPRLHKYKAPPPPPPPVIIASSTPEPAPAAKQTAPAAAPSKMTFFAKQTSTPPPVAEQRPPAAPEIARYRVEKIPDRDSPISRIAKQIAEMNAEAAKPAKPSANPEAWRAMKGSILLAGMPGAPAPVAAATPKPAPAATQPQPQANAASSSFTYETVEKPVNPEPAGGLALHGAQDSGAKSEQ